MIRNLNLLHQLLLYILSVNGGCFNEKYEMIQGCTCHTSCESCGYNEDPVKEFDCILCADGSDVKPVYKDWTGYCGDIKGCYDEDYVNLPYCTCHSSCESCRYKNSQINEFDCISCSDGSDVNPVYKDGSGHCGNLKGCYNDEYMKVSNCTCHSSCEACGYTSDNPIEEFNCISCADGSSVNSVNKDGTGHCSGSLKGCYNEDYVKLSNCTCHSSCEACGYNDYPAKEFDCLSCADGSNANPVHKDGTGHCGNLKGCYNTDHVTLANCTCHSSCEACGYYDYPIGKNDCISCADGSTVNPKYKDGTGSC